MHKENRYVVVWIVQRWTIRRALGCEKFPTSLAWLLLSKTGPPFSPSLCIVRCSKEGGCRNGLLRRCNMTWGQVAVTLRLCRTGNKVGQTDGPDLSFARHPAVMIKLSEQALLAEYNMGR